MLGNPYVRAPRSVPVSERLERVYRILGWPEDPYSEEGRVLEKDGVVRVYVREYETSLPRIVEAVLKARGRPMRITIAEPTLEDVFLRLTGRVLSGEA